MQAYAAQPESRRLACETLVDGNFVDRWEITTACTTDAGETPAISALQSA